MVRKRTNDNFLIEAWGNPTVGKGGSVLDEMLNNPELPVTMLPLEQLVGNPYQPRQSFGDEELDELRRSIEMHGFLGHLVARRYERDRYQIAYGERRLRASKLAGLDRLPVQVQELDDNQMMQIALAENLQRVDLSPLEEGVMYVMMMGQLHLSYSELAEMINKDKGYIQNRVRLAKAPDDLKQMVMARPETLSAVRYLVKVEDGAARKVLVAAMLDGRVTVKMLTENEGDLLGLAERLLHPTQAAYVRTYEQPEVAAKEAYVRTYEEEQEEASNRYSVGRRRLDVVYRNLANLHMSSERNLGKLSVEARTDMATTLRGIRQMAEEMLARLEQD